MSFSIPNYMSGTPQNYTSFSGFNQKNLPPGFMSSLSNFFTTGRSPQYNLQSAQPYTSAVSTFMQPSINQFRTNLDSVNANYDSAESRLPELFHGQLLPALQNALNGLASRGVLNSSVASNTLGNTATNTGMGILGLQQGLESQRTGALQSAGAQLGNAYGMQGQAQQGILDLLMRQYGSNLNQANNTALNMGRYSYSQDPLASQKLFLNTMYRMGGF